MVIQESSKMKMKRYVAGFMFDQENPNRVLLIHKNKPKWQAGKLNAIGGKIEQYDVSPGHAMVREFFEETGLKTEAPYHIGRVPFPNVWDPFVVLTNEEIGCRVHFFRSRGPVDQAKTMEEEAVEVVTWPFMVEVIPNLHWLVPLAADDDIRMPLYLDDLGGT